MKKILLVDDEPDFCHFVKANLQGMGNYEVIIAPKGKKGIKQALKNNPDVILLDIMMPGIDGFEVLKRLKKDRRTMSIPVIMLTAKDDEESKDEAIGSYCEEYIVKPVEMSVLKSKIDDLLSRFKRYSSHWRR